MEPAVPARLQCPRTQPKRMPDRFKAPYPSWMARYAEDAGPFVMAYFGVQQASLLPPDALAPIDAMLARGPVPGHVLHARCHDQAGFDTLAAIAYWSDPAAFTAWRQDSGFDAWWADPVRESGPVGWFLEVLTPSADRLEVLYSTPDGTEGVGHLQAHLSEQPVVEHAYWGSMRDRLPASQTEALTGPQGRPAAVHAGKRVRVAPRDNLSMIRSGQNWSQTEGHERSVYLEKVRPTLIAGMAYLRDHGRDIGCYSCRFMQVVDAHGAPTEKSFGHAYFATLGDLEAWAEHHPTHLAIFNTFLKTMAPLGAAMQLRLFHEVTALPASAQWFEYVNCHPQTGLLTAAAPRDGG